MPWLPLFVTYVAVDPFGAVYVVAVAVPDVLVLDGVPEVDPVVLVPVEEVVYVVVVPLALTVIEPSELTVALDPFGP